MTDNVSLKVKRNMIL